MIGELLLALSSISLNFKLRSSIFLLEVTSLSISSILFSSNQFLRSSIDGFGWVGDSVEVILDPWRSVSLAGGRFGWGEKLDIVNNRGDKDKGSDEVVESEVIVARLMPERALSMQENVDTPEEND